MANKLKFSGQSGLTAVAVITDRTNDDVWNGSDLVTYIDADFDNYKVSLTELGHGNYSADVPSALPAGRYHVAFYDDSIDEVIFQSLIEWTGTDVTEELETGDVSVTDICNMALSHLGIGKEIGNIETDDDEEAAAFNRFYENCRDILLRDFPWPFAMVTADLGLVEEDPTEEWAYSYRYPSNCLKLKRIQSGIRNDNQDSRIPYRVSRDDGGLLLYTDLEDAVIEYTFRETDPGRFPPEFVSALSFLLAFKMAPRLTAGDPFKLGDRAYQMYQVEIGKARASAGNEEVPGREPDSEFIRARD